MKDFLQAIVFGGLFLIPFLPIYVENDFFFPFITGKNFAFRIIIEAVFASWILLAFYDPKYRPKFSWILAGFSVLLIVMAAANALGEYPPKSFWSNFERMDGYVTLIHVFMYMIVLGSVITTQRLWSIMLHISVGVALMVALYGLMQYSGMAPGGKVRVDSWLGNAAYMAVYMLFHIFMVGYLFVKSKTTMPRVIYGLILAVFVYTLLLTGTRGTFIGFVGGSTLAVAYVALFGYHHQKFRQVAAVGFIGIVLAAGAFMSVRDQEFVQNSPALNRIANINILADLGTRGTIWGMALEGVKERPILGWGQGNFNYVFNEQYDPSLWNKEAWFDRVHNIFLDWLIAGGVLGLVAYLSIFVAAFYYLFWQSLFRKGDKEPTFDILERAVLIGLLAGYFAHNIVVFDNIISYIFFGLFLALIHSRVAEDIPSIKNWKLDERLIVQFALPLVVLVSGATIYHANASGLGATADIIDALQAPTIEGRLNEFQSALDRESFADQEIIEQLAQNAIQIARTPQIPAEEKTAFINAAERELQRLVAEKPGDARLHTFFSTFYRSINQFEKAREQAEIARSLSPKKQAIITEQGIIELSLGNNQAAKEFFREAFELYEKNHAARVLYAASLVNVGEIDTAKELIGEEYMEKFAMDNYALSVVQQSGDLELLTMMFAARSEKRPNNAQDRASLSFVHYQNGQLEESIAVLEQAAIDIPDFAPRAQCFIANIESGNQPDLDCN